MKLTIIREDGAVYQDRISYRNLDLSFVPSNVHALQWNNNKGWIEYSEDSNGNKQNNDMIDILPEWANTAIESWITANTAIESWITANTENSLSNTTNTL
jgi:hypothetical protein